MQACILGKAIPGADCSKATADLNFDGTISVADTTLLQATISGKCKKPSSCVLAGSSGVIYPTPNSNSGMPNPTTSQTSTSAPFGEEVFGGYFDSTLKTSYHDQLVAALKNSWFIKQAGLTPDEVIADFGITGTATVGTRKYFKGTQCPPSGLGSGSEKWGVSSREIGHTQTEILRNSMGDGFNETCKANSGTMTPGATWSRNANGFCAVSMNLKCCK
jgi:hypothetical protein